MQQDNQTLAINGGTPVITKRLTPHKRWDYQELREVIDVFDSGVLFRFGGEKVLAFEQAFADYYGAKHGVASSSGTAAIHIAVGMINPEPGDEIITAPITDGGSIVPILYQGAIPIFADSDPDTLCMDPASIEACVTPRTKAIMVVHLCGNPCDMDAILDIGKRHNIPIIEDCSQAHGAEYKGKLVGTIGDIGCFSLQSSKQITTGEGGMTITNNDKYGERGALFMDKGWKRGGWGPRMYELLSPNYRMPEILGAIGCAQVRKLPGIVEGRHRNGTLLRSLVEDLPFIQPQKILDNCKHTYWLWPLTVNLDAPFDASALAEALWAEGVGAGAHYIGEPIFMCMDAVWKKETLGESQFPFSYPGARQVEYNQNTCPVTWDALRRWVTINNINESTDERDIHDIATAIRKVVNGLQHTK